MVTGVVIQPCWKGNIDISPLSDTFDEGDGYPNIDHYGGFLQGGHLLMNRFLKLDLQFFPVNSRDLAPPFPPGVTPTVSGPIDLGLIPLWMFADMTWNLYVILIPI
jgi:hypothetical protein